MHRVALAGIFALTTLIGTAAAQPPSPPPGIVAGVESITSSGIPGPMVASGERSFIIAVGRVGGGRTAPVVVGGTMGDGRIVAFGHGGFISKAASVDAATLRLVAQSIERVSLSDSPRIGITNARLADALEDSGLAVVRLTNATWHGRLGELDVLQLGSHGLTDDDLVRLDAYIRGGGGLVIDGLGWGWLQLNPGRTIIEHPGNRLLARAGLAWADGTIEPGRAGRFRVTAEPAGVLHAGRALDALAADEADDDAAQAGWTVTAALRSLPPNDRTIRPTIRRLLADRGGGLIPSPDRPIRVGQALDRVLLAAQLVDPRTMTPQRVAAHPAAGAFPGPVPDEAPRVTRTMTIDPGRAGWHSTGLYAPPGEVVRVRLLDGASAQGLALRIGCHTDHLWHKDAWSRVPEIALRVPLAGVSTIAANPFGGLVYIDVGRGRTDGPFEIEIDGAVASPLFVLGATTNEQWRAGIRDLRTPWGELATDKIILSVPSAHLRTLDDPESVMRFWDEIADAMADLAAIPHERARPERFVADVQISAGYMHAGYPIMTHLDAAGRMVDLAAMRRGPWGLLHELGHNHQSRDWTFSGTGEVTNNVFVLYVIDTICDPGAPKHKAVTGEVGVADYFAQGSPFARWKREPFLALRMYVQVQQAFGWAPFERVFAEYRALPAGERPGDDDAKRDQWLVRLSHAVGHDLGPFFEAWGVPVSDEARGRVAHLPGWMPQGLPTRAGG